MLYAVAKFFSPAHDVAINVRNDLYGITLLRRVLCRLQEKMKRKKGWWRAVSKLKQRQYFVSKENIIFYFKPTVLLDLEKKYQITSHGPTTVG